MALKSEAVKTYTYKVQYINFEEERFLVYWFWGRHKLTKEDKKDSDQIIPVIAD